MAQNVVLLAAHEPPRQGRARRRRRKRKLKIGVDIPAPAEMRAIVAKLRIDEAARYRPLLLTAIFTGLRASRAARAALG